MDHGEEVCREVAQLSSRDFAANRARLQPFIFLHNPGNFLCGPALPKAVKEWSLRRVQAELIKMGGWIARHARRIIFEPSEVAVSRQLFAVILKWVSPLRLVPC